MPSSKPGQRPKKRTAKRPAQLSVVSPSRVPLTMTCSVSMKVNLQNYESAEAFASVSGITDETTADEIHRLLNEKGKIAWDALKEDIAAKVSRLKMERTTPQYDRPVRR